LEPDSNALSATRSANPPKHPRRMLTVLSRLSVECSIRFALAIKMLILAQPRGPRAKHGPANENVRANRLPQPDPPCSLDTSHRATGPRATSSTRGTVPTCGTHNKKRMQRAQMPTEITSGVAIAVKDTITPNRTLAARRRVASLRPSILVKISIEGVDRLPRSAAACVRDA